MQLVWVNSMKKDRNKFTYIWSCCLILVFTFCLVGMLSVKETYSAKCYTLVRGDRKGEDVCLPLAERVVYGRYSLSSYNDELNAWGLGTGIKLNFRDRKGKTGSQREFVELDLRWAPNSDYKVNLHFISKAEDKIAYSYETKDKKWVPREGWGSCHFLADDCVQYDSSWLSLNWVIEVPYPQRIKTAEEYANFIVLTDEHDECYYNRPTNSFVETNIPDIGIEMSGPYIACENRRVIIFRDDTGYLNSGKEKNYYTEVGAETTISSAWGYANSRSGYLLEWVDENGTVYSHKEVITVKNNMVLTAKWTEPYTVAYNANGGTGAPDNQIKTHGISLTLSDKIPTRDGYVFKNWNIKQDGSGKKYLAGANYTADADATLYAQWKYEVKYDANGKESNDIPALQSANDGVSLTIKDVIPTAPGYKFREWNTKPDGSGTSYAPGAKYNAMIGVTLYAQWDSPLYTITYNANGGSNSPKDQYKYHNITVYITDEMPTAPTLDGYVFTFDSWNTAANGTGISYSARFPYTANSSLTLYAQWKKEAVDVPQIKKCTVFYEANGAGVSLSKKTDEVTCGFPVWLPNAERECYAFEGWYTSKDGGDLAGLNSERYSVESDIVLYARWKPTCSNSGGQYKVTYYPGSCPVSVLYMPDVDTKIKGVSLKLSAAMPYCSGYKFKGWNTKSDGSGKLYDSGDVYNKNENLDLYAIWEEYSDDNRCNVRN